MPFKFRLQKLLEYRENKKKQAQEELARRQRKVQAVQQELMRLQDEEQRLLEKYQPGSEQGHELDIFNLVSMEHYRYYLQKCCGEQTKELQLAEKKLEEQRSVVMESWRECQVLSVLRDKAEHHYREEEKSHEQRLNDELGLNCFMRRRDH